MTTEESTGDEQPETGEVCPACGAEAAATRGRRRSGSVVDRVELPPGDDVDERLEALLIVWSNGHERATTIGKRC